MMYVLISIFSKVGQLSVCNISVTELILWYLLQAYLASCSALDHLKLVCLRFCDIIYIKHGLKYRIAYWIISLRLGFRRNFLSVSSSSSLHKPYQRYSGNLKFEPLVHSDGYFAWTDCVRSSAGKVSYLDIF